MTSKIDQLEENLKSKTHWHMWKVFSLLTADKWGKDALFIKDDWKTDYLYGKKWN